MWWTSGVFTCSYRFSMPSISSTLATPDSVTATWILGLLDLVVLVALQPRRDPRERLVPLGAVGHHAADDQRRPRLVDEDRVDLVHDRVLVAVLHAVLDPHRHVVAQVVEPELVVRPVRDRRAVRGPALGRRHRGLDQPDLHAERSVDRPHPLRVALGQVVVHGHQVHAPSREGVEVRRHGGDERLALTGLHLGDVPLVQRGGAHDLHVEMPLARRALRRLADRGERLGQQVVERLAVLDPLTELGGLGQELGVGEVLELRLVRQHELRDRLQVLPLASLAEVRDLVQYHVVRPSREFGGSCRSVPRFYRPSPASPGGVGP